MSKKKARRKKSPAPQSKGRIKRKGVIAVALLLMLSIAGLALAQWRTLHRAFNPLAPSPTPTPALQLSKEYIYAGGKLIATEEPGNGAGSSPLPAPSALSATGYSSPNSYVDLSWTASTGTGVDHYQVERCANVSVTPSCYTAVATNVPASGNTVNFTDTISGGGGVTAYLYRVRGANADNTQFSEYSQPELATTITFMDDPLNPPGTKTVIKAQHLVELRQAVNAVRALAGLGQASWTYADPVSSPSGQRRAIHIEDMTDLRTGLDAALTVLNRSQPYPANPTLASGAPVSAAHFAQIRERVQ